MYSSDGSKDDAADLASNIGAHYEVQPIEPLFNAYQQQLDLDGVSAENLQARIRGVIVMASSNSRGLLAVATGNKSELCLRLLDHLRRCGRRLRTHQGPAQDPCLGDQPLA